MKVNTVAQSANNQAFGALKIGGNMSRNSRKFLQEKIFPVINPETVDKFEKKGFDVVFKKGYFGVGDTDKQFDIFLRERKRKPKEFYATAISEGSITHRKLFNMDLADDLTLTLLYKYV